MVPDDDEMDVAPAADQDADLSVGLAGDLAELPGKLEGEHPVDRDFTAVELLDAPDLVRLESGRVAMYLVYVSNPPWGMAYGEGLKAKGEERDDVLPDLSPYACLLFKLVRIDLALHRVEELGPRVGLERGDELAGLSGAALRAWVVRSLFAQLVEYLEDMGALDAFIVVQGHGKRSAFWLKAKGKWQRAKEKMTFLP